MAFTTLAHHLDVAMLERAFWGLNPRSAAGVDRVTWRGYKRDLESKLEVLHEQLVNGTYTPQPVVRTWIPKQNGKLPPLGLPALEDKIVAKAVSTLLEQIYEQDFCDFSYGFRPGRSCQGAGSSTFGRPSFRLFPWPNMPRFMPAVGQQIAPAAGVG